MNYTHKKLSIISDLNDLSAFYVIFHDFTFCQMLNLTPEIGIKLKIIRTENIKPFVRANFLSKLTIET